jgi:hypothetical protein
LTGTTFNSGNDQALITLTGFDHATDQALITLTGFDHATDQALITLTGFDHATFDYLLLQFLHWYDNYTTLLYQRTLKEVLLLFYFIILDEVT